MEWLRSAVAYQLVLLASRIHPPLMNELAEFAIKGIKQAAFGPPTKGTEHE